MPRRGQGAAIATRDDERNLSSGISYILLRVLLMTKFRRNRTAVLKTRLNVVTMHRQAPQRATRSTTDAFTPVKFTRALLASAFLWLTHNTRAGNLISDLVY